jgi:small subunit ribosomal protein S20
MASHKSAKKCIRKTVRQTLVNRNRVSRIRTFVRTLECMLTSTGQSAENLNTAFVAAQREIMRGVNKGVLHRNTAARRISGLARKVKALVQ